LVAQVAVGLELFAVETAQFQVVLRDGSGLGNRVAGWGFQAEGLLADCVYRFALEAVALRGSSNPQNSMWRFGGVPNAQEVIQGVTICGKTQPSRPTQLLRLHRQFKRFG
jgi:hypothetical protein